MRTIQSVAAATFVFILAACAPSAPVSTAPVPTTPVAPTMKEAPLNWHLLDSTDRVPGISLLRAERELLAGKSPRRTVIVAVIDNGLDTSHVALKDHLWSNPGEVPGNGRDDDNNGFVDDTRGWNLIGGKDGRNVHQDTYELTRIVAQCGRAAGKDSLPIEYRVRCPELENEWSRKKAEISQTLVNIRQYETVVNRIVPVLKRALGTDSVTRDKVQALTPATDSIRKAREIFLQLANQGITPDDIYEAKKSYESQEQYGYSLKFDPRPIVGDNYPDTTVKRYGNRDVHGPEPEHGTHVAGIIAASRDGGGTGIAPNSVKIMAVRTVPDGDERDKDIANAIRYAVDEGANVINMSFGKAYSPYKPVVDAAVKYADSKGVLMVHGAGNEGEDLASHESFPIPSYKDGSGRAINWIEVGASSWHSNDSLVANFSNYGKAQVDVFAPGVDIYSTFPDNKYKKNSGTSMASPVVAGLAALIMSYYPSLSAADVKKIIVESSIRMADKMVLRPGDGGGTVRFGDLSISGGIVNAYSALKMAEEMSRARP
jgi:subtilisin family serine protease